MGWMTVFQGSYTLIRKNSRTFQETFPVFSRTYLYNVGHLRHS